MTIPQEAIEAATQALMTENACAKDNYNRCKVHTGSRWDLAEDVCRDAQGEAELALEAALPALERQIRERVAKEIEAARPAVHPARKGGKAAHYALTNAARIARGYWL